MPKRNKSRKDIRPIEPTSDPSQSAIAEGDLDTVEESIRKHEEKGDLQPQDSRKTEERILAARENAGKFHAVFPLRRVATVPSAR